MDFYKAYRLYDKSFLGFSSQKYADWHFVSPKKSKQTFESIKKWLHKREKRQHGIKNSRIIEAIGSIIREQKISPFLNWSVKRWPRAR